MAQSLNDQVVELSRNLSATTMELESTQAELLAQNQAIEVARSTTARLQGDLEIKQAEVDVVRGAMAVSEAELFDRIAELSALEAQIEELGRQKALVEFDRDLHLAELAPYRAIRDAVVTWDDIAQDLAQSVTFARDRSALAITPELFDSGSPDLQSGADVHLNDLAQALLFLSRELPQDMPWAFLVRGHSDGDAISTDRFPSNWELSAARAATVARYLVDQGLDPQRLQVAGQAQFLQPSGDLNARRVSVDFQILTYELVGQDGL